MDVKEKMNLQPIKTMILGTMIMLLGGIIILDQSSDLGGIELFIVLIGLIIGMIGLFQKD
jgi:hypothetical protein